MFSSSVHAGADPEILHGMWLVGWLPIVNYTDAKGWGSWLIMVDISYTTLYKRTSEGGGQPPYPPPLDQPLLWENICDILQSSVY